MSANQTVADLFDDAPPGPSPASPAAPPPAHATPAPEPAAAPPPRPAAASAVPKAKARPAQQPAAPRRFGFRLSFTNVEFGLLALAILVGFGLMAVLNPSGGQPATSSLALEATTQAAAAAPDAGDTEAGIAAASVVGAPAAAPVPEKVTLLFTWSLDSQLETGECATPLVLMERTPQAPGFVRIDCNHDGVADVWTLIGQGGITQEQINPLPAR